ncbi:FKBP-type peptidyl-prolyl cis-trans isomerase [Candidatus Saccharibacteria bacterium]|nr:FKBP-type peptidyl-prolyl cis-trans isomerase [Candidatus Saccharibacteria bacterium]
MDEKELKTSPKQRIFIILIAIIMVGSIVASYAAIVISGAKGATSGDGTGEIDEAKVAEYLAAYEKKEAEFKEASKGDYEKFIKYKTEIKAYNEATANAKDVAKRDLKTGSGAELTDNNYLAYYVGWCADESVFDSSFDDNNNPTSFAKILDPSLGMIEGWNVGVKGMKIGGIREITVPGELAYGDSMEICGGYNKPLKFMIMAVANEGSLSKLATELDDAYMRYQYAMYGVDYDSIKQNTE